MEVNKMRVPRVAYAIGNDDSTTVAHPNDGLGIRFPYFDRAFIPGCDDGFIELYERAGLNKPHSLSEYASCRYVFSSFKDESGSHMVPGDADFWGYIIRSSSEEMVFLDAFFDDFNLYRLLDVLGLRKSSNLLSVTVLTVGGHSALTISRNEKDFRVRIGNLHNAKVQILRLEKGNEGLVHDRFALIDNHIWHFGAAIGGMHDKIHAYSGPWDDVDMAFKALIDDLRKGATPIL